MMTSPENAASVPQISATFTPQTPHFSHAYKEFICGWGSAFINVFVTFPLHKAMFRQQLLGISSFTAIQQLRNEGLRNLYRGLLPPLLQKTTSNFMMFGIYYKSLSWLDGRTKTERVFSQVTAAMIAGSMEATLTPFERVQVLLQTTVYQKRFKNTLHAFKELSAYGFKEYYRGFSAVLMRNGSTNTFFFLGRDYLGSNLPVYDNHSVEFIKNFASGALLGAFISTASFPINVVKSRMQSELGTPFKRNTHVFKIIWNERDRNVRNLFKGVHLNYTRSFFSWGIINASYELLMKSFFSDNDLDA